MKLGITIRMGAEGFTLSGPEGTADLSILTRDQRRTVAGMVSEAMGLSVQPTGPQRAPRRRRFNRSIEGGAR